ncbi:uncharacterized protein HMPREF1541_05865 [Cyphellophora europaea CBS 101466]|uniref:alpha-1,2-Mannosidase n=1 Tax=Cyphellophora europaea (strain CBS 101466) TaxID=1220924 RepID=W2RVA4_CYPE1|nr:uncharacterized protein HMPREF1541_05865 [Cyphellophora europaea CBS 101466]ETN39639.1 hypothetical protein HMPREF1541_05865 [Cyphellophora europaea CBS 101466]
MLLIRKLWVAPALCFFVAFYYLFLRSPTSTADTYYGDVHWKKWPERYPVESLTPLPTGSTPIPRIQFDFASHPETVAQKSQREERRQTIKDAFVHAWGGYKAHAFGKDEVMPLSGSSLDNYGGWGATLVDALDTLWLMGMKEEFEAAVEAVMKIDFTTNSVKELNVFETTIRYLGGMMAAYDVSEGKYPQLLDKAKELGEILYSAFDTTNRMPVCRWDWRKSALGGQVQAADFTLLAELGSLSLEFTRLSQLTQDPKYYDSIARISSLMADAQDGTLIAGLWPTIVDARNLRFDYNHFTLGGMADSTYEYLPKEYMLLNGAIRSYRTMYEKALDAASRFLFFKPMVPTNADILFSGTTALTEQGQASLDPQGQHLTCFLAGMVGIGAQIFDRPSDLKIAKQLLDGCIWAYNATPSGLMPETFHVVPCAKGIDADTSGCEWDDGKYFAAVTKQLGGADDDPSVNPVERGKILAKEKKLVAGFTAHGDSRYILRPEAIESVFILYRITGERRYQEDAWRMWQSIDKATRTDIANAAVVDVRLARPEKSDRMESFWLAETLKYFYLIFDDSDVVDLDKWVLNTEAHPFRRPAAA